MEKKRDYRVVVLNIFLLLIVILFVILLFTSSPNFSGNVLKSVFRVDSSKSSLGEIKIIEEPKTLPKEIEEPLDIPQGMDEKTYLRFSSSSAPPGTTDFFGTVNIDGISAPVGTIVYAMAPNNGEGVAFECGSFIVNQGSPGIGWYGVLHCVCGGENPDCSGQEIYFEIKLPNGFRKLATVQGNSIWDESFKQVNIYINTRCSEDILEGQCDAQIKPLRCEEVEINSFEMVPKCQVCGCLPSYWDYKNNRRVYWCCNNVYGSCSKQYSPCSNTGGT